MQLECADAMTPDAYTPPPPRLLQWMPCPVCSMLFKDRQGRGGHLRHSKDPAHTTYRAQNGLSKPKRSRYPNIASGAPAIPRPSQLSRGPPRDDEIPEMDLGEPQRFGVLLEDESPSPESDAPLPPALQLSAASPSVSQAEAISPTESASPASPPPASPAPSPALPPEAPASPALPPASPAQAIRLALPEAPNGYGTPGKAGEAGEPGVPPKAKPGKTSVPAPASPASASVAHALPSRPTPPRPTDLQALAHAVARARPVPSMPLVGRIICFGIVGTILAWPLIRATRELKRPARPAEPYVIDAA